jgi:hypothetical protein
MISAIITSAATATATATATHTHASLVDTREEGPSIHELVP